jgi:hypothetical protein
MQKTSKKPLFHRVNMVGAEDRTYDLCHVAKTGTPIRVAEWSNRWVRRELYAAG